MVIIITLLFAFYVATSSMSDKNRMITYVGTFFILLFSFFSLME